MIYGAVRDLVVAVIGGIAGGGVTFLYYRYIARPTTRTAQTVKSWIPGFLAVSITLGFFGLLGLLIAHAVPTESEKPVYILTGSLGTAWVMVVSYHFGSSAGSERKTELLADDRLHRP